MIKIFKAILWFVLLAFVYFLFQTIGQYELQLSLAQFNNTSNFGMQVIFMLKNYDYVAYILIILGGIADITLL